MVAPFAVYYEVPAAILKTEREGRLSSAAAMDALNLFLQLELPIVGGTPESARTVARVAYPLAASLKCSYYDAIFLGLAQILQTQVITADDKLNRNIGARTSLLVMLENFALP